MNSYSGMNNQPHGQVSKSVKHEETPGGRTSDMIRKTWIIPFLLALFLQPAQAQLPPLTRAVIDTTMPDGVWGERIVALIRTINANDREILAKFLQDECTERFRVFAPLDAHAGAFGRVFRESGGVDFLGVRADIPKGTPGAVVILMDRKPGGLHDVRVIFDAEEGSLIAGVRFGTVELQTEEGKGLPAPSDSRNPETPAVQNAPRAGNDTQGQEVSK